MKSILQTTLFIALSTLLFCCNKHEIREIKHGNGKLFEQFSVIETKEGSFIKDDDYKTWYENGTPASQGFYEMGKKTGNWKFWYPNGQIQSDYSLVRDTLDGEFIKWYENGQKSTEGTKKMSVDINDWTAWYENGQMSSKTTYDTDGKREGVHTAWHENGQKSSEINFVNGVKEGDCKFWDTKGQLFISLIFKNGVDISLPKSYKNDSGQELDLMPDGTYKIKYFEKVQSFFFSRGYSDEGKWKTETGKFELVNDNLKLKGYNEFKIKKYNSDSLVVAGRYNDVVFVKVAK